MPGSTSVSVPGFVSVSVSVVLLVTSRNRLQKRSGNGAAPKSCILSSCVVQSWTLKIMKQPLVQDFRTPESLNPCTIAVVRDNFPRRRLLLQRVCPRHASQQYVTWGKSCLLLVHSSSPLPRCTTLAESGFGGNVVMSCRARIVTAMVRMCVCYEGRQRQRNHGHPPQAPPRVDKHRQATTKPKQP